MKVIVRKDDKKFLNDYHMINVRPIAGVDLNYKESITSDYTVIITGLCDPFGKIYVVDMFRKRINIEDFPKYFFSYFRKWHWEEIGIDANANQIVVKPFLEVFYRLKYSELFPGEKTDEVIGYPKITPLESQGTAKISMIESILTAEWRNIKFLSSMNGFEEIKSELRNIRNTEHDDIGDALANMVRVKSVPPMVDMKMIDPSTGVVRRKNPGLLELTRGMNEFDRMMVT